MQGVAAEEGPHLAARALGREVVVVLQQTRQSAIQLIAPQIADAPEIIVVVEGVRSRLGDAVVVCRLEDLTFLDLVDVVLAQILAGDPHPHRKDVGDL